MGAPRPRTPRRRSVERLNRTIKEATAKRFHHETHDQLRTHLADFMAAWNFARRRKTLSGLTPYEYIAEHRMSAHWDQNCRETFMLI